MAGAGGTTPLRLKDLLELDCDSCSAAGFRCYPRRLLGESSSAPTMRRLLESPSSLRRHSPTKLSHLSRSLSRRLLSRGGLFGRRRDEEDDEDDAGGAAAAPSGSGSESGASSSGTTTSDSSSGRRGSRCESSDSDFSTATTSSSANSDSMAAAAAAVNDNNTGDEHEGMKRSGSSSGSEPDDKEEELSPVAVMDFPSDDDEEGEDGDADGASFSLARLQRRKMLRRQYKIRRFGSTQELGPVDLETLLAATSESDTSDTDDLADDVLDEQQVIPYPIGDTAAAAPRPSRNDCHGAGVHHETHEHGLLELLVDADSVGVDHVSERLLLDFSIEMKRRRGSMERSETTGRLLPLPREDERLGDGEVVAAAKRWLDGAGSERWGLSDVLRGGEAIVAEMERGRRWMQVGEEEREVGVVVASMLADLLVDEVVWDLLV